MFQNWQKFPQYKARYGFIREIASVAGLGFFASLLLLLIQTRVIAVHSHESGVSAGFNYPSLIQYDDPVKFKQREYAVGYNNGSFLLQVGVEPADNFFLRPRIHGAQAIVKDYQFMIFGQGTGYRDSLLLASAQSNAAFSDQGIESGRKLEDLLVNAGESGCFPRNRFGLIFATE